MYEKYAFIATGIVAYSDAGPESGNVPPILTDVAVTPVSVDRGRRRRRRDSERRDERERDEHDSAH